MTGWGRKLLRSGDERPSPQPSPGVPGEGGRTIMTQLMEEKNVHAANFEQFERQRNGDGLPWLDRLRRSGIERFNAVGFPTTQDEEWRFTDIRPIVRTRFALPS